MNFAIVFIVAIAKLLIAIGDGVIIVGKSLSARFHTAHSFLRHRVNIAKSQFFTWQAKRSKTLLRAKKTKKKQFATLLTRVKKIRLPAFHLSFPKRFAITKAPKIEPYFKMPKHVKPASAFIPFTFIVKLKYFLAGIVFSFLFLFLPLVTIVFLQDLPSPKVMTLGQIPQTTKIYDRNGRLLYQIYAGENRTIVPLNRIPLPLRQATIAVEDKDFYKHPGFDIFAIIRSTVENLSGKQLQGGSTLTQQLIKSALLTPETTITRKVKEVILAFWAERMFSKEQILEMYFNQIPYGGTAWGIEAATETYFNKHVEQLDLAESAFLAGIPRAPTIYSPYGTTPTLWKKRQKEVLYRMVYLGYITKKQADEALEKPLKFQPAPTPINAPHFVMYVKDYLTKKYGLSMVERGGLIVRTSLDLSLQEQAQKIVSEEVANNLYLHVTNGASLITNPKNGDIVAMVGSKNFAEPGTGNFNVTTSLRQPGSSIKILTYATGLSQGLTAATILDDSPITFTSPGSPSYTPVNYDGKFHGRIPLRQAFANSFNIPAVKTLNQVGIPAMVELGKNLGIKSWDSPDNYGLAITLGAAETTMLEMATVYGTFANGGEKVELNPILKVTDYKGNVLEEKREHTIPKERVLDPGIAFIVSNILSDNGARSTAFGSNSLLNIPGKTVSVKTGTSDWKKDNWTIGYTPSYVVTVWVGNNDGSPMNQAFASGVTGAAPIWHRTMRTLLASKADETLTPPSNIVAKPCLGRIEYFIKGTETSVNCAFLPRVAKKKEENKPN